RSRPRCRRPTWTTCSRSCGRQFAGWRAARRPASGRSTTTPSPDATAPCTLRRVPVSSRGSAERLVLNQRRFIVGAVLIAAAVSYLVYAGIRTTSMYYFDMDEFLASRDAHAGETMRVKGWVRQGSMRWDARTNQLDFELAHKDNSAPVGVSYHGILPD